MRDEELLDRMEQRENYMILYRFQNCVRNMLKAKLEKETMIPMNWIDNMDIPSITCEYTEEHWKKVKGMKEDLECLAGELGLALQKGL